MSKIITIKNLQRFLSNLKSNYFDNIDSRLNTLNDEIKDKIENTGGGADWNAQEGETGYIENKPFRIIKSKDDRITNINSYFIRTENEYYPTNDLIIKYNNKTALLAKEKQELYWGDGASVVIDGIYFYLVDENMNIIVTSEINADFELIIALNSEFIPDTVLKTTLQTLSDNDKNQALDNLGLNIASQSEIDALFENGNGSGSNIS